MAFSPVLVFCLYLWGALNYVYFLIYETYFIAYKICIGITFVLLLIMSFGAYLQCFFTDHDQIPDEFSIPSKVSFRSDERTEDIMRELRSLIMKRNLPILTLGALSKEIKYCAVCRVIKPDRTHHCSKCNKCILKMDHHCIWIGNCVGHSNYKAFMLFLLYTLALVMFYLFTIIPFVVHVWSARRPLSLVFFVGLLIMSFIPILVLTMMHLYFIVQNQTTMESYMPPLFCIPELNDYKYNLGFLENIYQVFGRDPLKWMVPWIPGPGNGIVFPLIFQNEIHDNLSEEFYIEPRISSSLERVTFLQRRPQTISGQIQIPIEQ